MRAESERHKSNLLSEEGHDTADIHDRRSDPGPRPGLLRAQVVALRHCYRILVDPLWYVWTPRRHHSGSRDGSHILPSFLLYRRAGQYDRPNL